MGNQATKYAPIMKARELTKSGQFMQITVFTVRLIVKGNSTQGPVIVSAMSMKLQYLSII